MPILQQDVAEFPEDLLADAPRDPVQQWRVVYTKPRQEKALARQLLCHDIAFYLPLIPKENLIRKRRVRSFLPLFNGYLFMYGSDDDRVQALATNRVVQMIDVVDQEVLWDELGKVRKLIASDAPLTVERRLQPGTLVRVKRGALEGMEGVVIRRQKVSRLVVAVSYLNQGVSVEIDDFMVEPV